MSLSRELACYHEAGHGIMAYVLSRDSLSPAVFSLTDLGVGGRWVGEVNDVNMGEIHEDRHADVALAGLLAEARWNGEENAAADGQVILVDDQPDLATVLADYYELEETDENEAELEKTPVVVQRGDGEPLHVRAGISFADLKCVPPGQRDSDALSPVIDRMCQIINDDEWWSRIGLLADALNAWNWDGPGPFDYIAFCQATGLQQ